MARVLVLFAHPALEKSRVHAALLPRIPRRPEVTFHDLYEAYPDYAVDVAREQQLLVEHEVVVLQHPFFWYGIPPLAKQWVDLVLEHGWAYGSEGRALRGKWFLHAISAGGRESAYRPDGYNRFTVRQLLAPMEQTARLCGMVWLPPFVIHGTHRMDAPEIVAAAARYARLLDLLADDELDPARAADAETLNALVDTVAAGGAPGSGGSAGTSKGSRTDEVVP